MQVEDRSQNSIVTSLSELREIERQRIADEVAALQRAEAARIAARVEAERRAREEVEARARAEHEAKVALEQARLEAAREERRRIDAAAAAELARQQLALEQARMEREMELRREAVARTRPRWMVAVTSCALVAAIALLGVTVNYVWDAREAQDRARVAQIEREEAKAAAQKAHDELMAVQRESEEHARTLVSLGEQLQRADSDAKRKDLEKKIREEQQAQRERDARLAKLAAEKARQERLRGIVVSDECKRNSLCR
jgi:hypothetical protein